jgi:poly(3-hydroxyalkanoate) synthetase
MADLFELWRLMCVTALSRGLEQLTEAVPGVTAARPPSQPDVIDLSAFPTLGRVRIELATMLLLEQREQIRSDVPAVLIVAPYAVHDASIADFALEHSVAQILSEARPGFIALTFWKSATVAMRNYGIDAYLSDLNVAIDDLGGRASLVGLCEGGWLAAVYAARFPRKVAKLVLAGAPIDLAAAESPITRLLATVSPMMMEQFMGLAGGRVLGSLSLALSRETTAEAALQRTGDDALVARFDDWNARAIDLPGVFFLQTTEWLFRENRLARDCFPALGRLVGLSEIKAPIFVLAAADDEVVTLPQAVAAKSLCRGTSVAIRVEPGGHLSLFMGRRTLDGAWREIAHWLRGGKATACHDPAPLPG